jgi:hypothetical protein
MRHRLHIYPRASAMHGAWELWCFGGYLLVFPPVRSCGERQRLRAYWSPNATPWHHGMVPLWGTRKPTDCSCDEPGCPMPRWASEEDPHV